MDHDSLTRLMNALLKAEAQQDVGGRPWSQYLSEALDDDFVARSSRPELLDQDREGFIRCVAKNTPRDRHIAEGSSMAWVSEPLGVLRCDVRLDDDQDPRYRNIAVFKEQGDHCKCVYLQITAHPPDEKELFERAQDEAEFQRAKIMHENDLLNHRLSWLTTSQSIFFAAYVFAFSSLKTFPVVFRHALPLIAILTCLSFFVGMIAALFATKHIREKWTDKFPGRGYENALFAGEPWTRWAGNVPPWIVPPLFIVAWAYAMWYDITKL